MKNKTNPKTNKRTKWDTKPTSEGRKTTSDHAIKSDAMASGNQLKIEYRKLYKKQHIAKTKSSKTTTLNTEGQKKELIKAINKGTEKTG